MKKRRDELREQEKEALIDTVLLLEGRMKALEKQMQAMKKLLQMPSQPAARPVKTPKNSSLPSGQSWQGSGAGKTKKKRGPKVGHEGKSWEKLPPDEVLECLARLCAGGGQALAELSQQPVGSRQIIDLKPLQYVVGEARCSGRHGPSCGLWQGGEYPEGFETAVSFGRQLQQVVLYLHHAHPLSYQRVQQLLGDLFGLAVSAGALVTMVHEPASLLNAAAESIRAQVKQASVVGCDESEARVNGQNGWQWVFQTPEWVYMPMHRRRNRAVIGEVLEAARPECHLPQSDGWLSHASGRNPLC